MGLLNIFKRKDKRNNYSFDEDDRRQSKEIRQLNAERKKVLQEIEIEKARMELEKVRLELDDYYDDEEEEQKIDLTNPDSALITLLSQIFLKGNVPQNNHSVNTPSPSPISAELTQEDIKNIVATIPPKFIKEAKKMPEEQLISIGKMQYPQLTEQQMKQIISYIKQ